jgi:Smg protein
MPPEPTGVDLRERVLAIVSIIAQYVMGDREAVTENDIVEELLAVGFVSEEIDAAFSWMQNLALQKLDPGTQLPEVRAQRIFTAEEVFSISAEARGLLIRLRMLGILDDQTQEEIIDKALQVAEDEITLKEMKAIAAMTLFAHTNDEWRREVDCFLADDWGRLYH